MSLTNPTELRQARTARRRPVVRGIVSAVMLGSLAVAGYAWGQQFILGFDKANDPLLATAIVSGVVAWFSFLLFSISTLGSWRLAPWLLVLGLLLFGTGLIVPGLSIGDPLFDFPDWLGLVPIGLALLLALSLIRARGLRQRRVQRETHTQNTGTQTVATVTNVPPGPDPSSRGLWGVVTFEFTDSAGTQRWVERSMLIPRAGDVKVGDTTLAWYNAANPGSDADIVIELARDNPLHLPS